MMSVAQAILLRNYPIEKRGMALGLWSMVIMIAPIFGPIIGGWITDNFSWPWLFYINLPVGAFSAIASWSILRHRESNTVKLPIDVVGSRASLVIGVGSLQFMLDNGNDKDWFNSPVILAAAVTAIVAVAFFIPWELTDKHRSWICICLRSAIFASALAPWHWPSLHFQASTSFFPLWLQTTVGYTATWAGLAVASGRALGSGDCAHRRPQYDALEFAASPPVSHSACSGSRFLDRYVERERQFLSICDAAFHARLGDGILLFAAESNPDVRRCFQ